ncbi:MAG: hypothetical protein RPU52_13845 [Candidatus Sedimenticola sp. (ex Thyasira tokunagai)]
MKPITKTLIATTLCLLTTAPVSAGYSYKNQNNDLFNRMIDQHNMIERGVEKGRLTEKEERILKRQQRKFFSQAVKFREDGQISRKEQRKLHKMLDRSEKRIKEFKRDHRNYRSNYLHDYSTSRSQRSFRWW